MSDTITKINNNDYDKLIVEFFEDMKKKKIDWDEQQEWLDELNKKLLPTNNKDLPTEEEKKDEPEINVLR